MRKRRRLADKLTIMVCAVLVAVSAFFYAPMEVSAATEVPDDFTGVHLDDDGVYRYYENGVLGSGKGMILYDGHYYYVRSQGNVATSSYQCLGTNNHLLPPRNYTFESDGKLIEFNPSDRDGVRFDCFCGYAHYYVDGVNTAIGIVKHGNSYMYFSNYWGFPAALQGMSYYVSRTNGLIPEGTYEFDEYGFMINPPSDDPTYDDGYQDGYNAGFEAGEDSVDADSFYQQGYEAGLELGESSGYESGYNAGFDDGKDSVDTDSYYQQGFEAGKESVDTEAIYQEAFKAGQNSIDTDSIYQTAFEAGKNSVDTDAYYNEGYQKGFEAGVTEAFAQGYQEGLDEGYAKGYDEGYDAGYAIGYSDGYSVGFDEGYQSAMDRIAIWGADTTDYPLLLLDKPLMSRVFDIPVKSSIPTQYSDFGEWTTDLIYNPNHTYRFNVVLNPTEYKEGSADIYFLNEDIFYLNVGGIKYRISNFSTAYVNTFFVPGDRMSSAFSFSWEPLLAVMGDTFESGTAYCYYDLNYQIYDMGPSGDTQNHIANQTDSLTNGFNDSHGNSVNNEFASGLNDFETAEDSLFATAATGMKDFTFFDISSVPAMVTGMSFVGSIMSGWFTQAGGASGVGIVLSILFSIMLVAMVLGLYRWYQSKGGKD